MRILFPSHQGSAAGGIGTVARGVARHVPEHLAPTDEFVELAPAPEGAHRRLDTRGAIARLWFEQASLARAATSYDLVHLCDLRPLMLSRTPFVITVHDVFFLDHPHFVPPTVRRYKTAMLRAALAKRPAAVFCDSEFTRGRLLANMPKASERSLVEVVYPGVEPGTARWEPNIEEPYFLTVSTVEPRKNHLGLLEAFREARKEGLELRWLVAGAPGRLSDPILAELRAEPGVEVLGPVSQDDLERLYEGATFVATPSLVEGYGYPPLEAMIRGVPTISSDASSLPEVILDAGVLVDPADHDAWAEQLLALSGDAERLRGLSVAGSARAEQLNWSNAASEIVEVYRRIGA